MCLGPSAPLFSGWLCPALRPSALLFALAALTCREDVAVSLLFLSLGSARAFFPILIPLIVLTGSSFPEQARLGGAYALLLLPYLFLGIVLTLARPYWRRLLANGRVAWVLCCLLMAFSVRDPRYPVPTQGLSEAHRGVEETSRLPGLRRLLAQG